MRANAISAATRPGRGRHHDDARGEIGALGHRVRDEHDREPVVAPQADEIVVQRPGASARRAPRTARPSRAASDAPRARAQARPASACRRRACADRRVSKPLSPTRSSAACVRWFASSRGTRRRSSGRRTLSRAVAHGISVGSWNTKPIAGLPCGQMISPALGSEQAGDHAQRRATCRSPTGPSSDRNSPSRMSRSSGPSAFKRPA